VLAKPPPFGLRDLVEDPRPRNLQPTALDRLPEQVTILGAADHVDRGADQLDTELLEHTGVGELHREVESRLPTERRQDSIGSFPTQDVGDPLQVERLDVGAVGEAGVGHDRGRVGVDDDRAEAVLAEHLQRLAAGVVELAGLTDHNRPRADHADRVEVVSSRH
jgi:hypothetical protein